ncbi:MAG: solute carrier family 23 protein, partial [Methylocystaceae bacterium]
MEFKFGINDRPDMSNLLVAALQWLAVGIPSLVIIAQVMGTIPEQGTPVLYLQKLLAATAITLLLQVWLGHRLPLIMGPSNIILVGILASQHATMDVIKTAIVACGLLLAILSSFGLFNHLQSWFTSRVVAVILLLVAFAITPTIRDLIIDIHGGNPLLYNLLIALTLMLLIMTAHHYLQGLWQSALIFIFMLAGSAAYYLLLPTTVAGIIPGAPFWGIFWPDITIVPTWDPGVL